ncbi:MAG: hypothetical protein EOP06_12775 [Proteobacteria bacterium]|nr:MAG: hypothetical protein EOP06_12775 [Pseudomonadota bacterium]
MKTGETIQLTNIRTGESGTGRSASAKTGNTQEEWLKADQLKYFEVLRTRKEKRELGDDYDKSTRQKEMRSKYPPFMWAAFVLIE